MGRQRLQDEHVERALDQIRRFLCRTHRVRPVSYQSYLVNLDEEQTPRTALVKSRIEAESAGDEVGND
jgi:hypothetical protein